MQIIKSKPLETTFQEININFHIQSPFVGPSRYTERGVGVNQYWTILSLTYFNPIKHQQVITQLYTCTQIFYMETQFGKNHKCFSYIM